jgi:PAS domain S-box-containing protein
MKRKKEKSISARKKTVIRPVLRRLLAPLTGVLLLLVGGFGLVLVNTYKNNLNQLSEQVLEEAADELAEVLAEQFKDLAALQEVFLSDAGLRETLKDRDRERLLADYGNIFTWLREKNGITHFYFHRPDRVNLLRVHRPEKNGDLIDRFTMLEAERTGATSGGIELGSLGTFTLRVVRPVFDGDTLIGYLELGKEIEDILAGIHHRYGVELVVAIHKSALDRAQWESGMKMLGRKADWDRFSGSVLIYSSMPRVPSEFAQYLSEAGHTHGEVNVEMEFHGKSWHLLVSPLKDVSGAEVGDLIILNDISTANATFNRLLAASVGLTLVLLAGLVSFLYVLLRKTDQGIILQQEEVLQSRDQYQSLVFNIPGIVYQCALDKDRTMYTMSAHAEQIAGYPPSDFVNNAVRTWESIIHREDTGYVDRIVNEAVESGKRWEIEYRIHHRDGSIRWVHEKGRGIIGKDGQVEFVEGLVLDITDRKQAAEALEEYSERLEEMVEKRTKDLKDAQEQLIRKEKLSLLGQLAGGVGHELRNPLGVISNAVYYLKTVLSDADENIKEYFETISSEVDRATKIVSDLLDFSRVKSIDREEIAITELISRALEKQPAPENIEIITRIPPDLSPVLVDPLQIEQVFDNLVTNACQAMPEGGKLTIEAKAEEDKTLISVADTGSGISQENMEKLFEPLFTTKARGIGLGLAISKILVEANGGSIEVKSEEGGGSTFTVILPIKEVVL